MRTHDPDYESLIPYVRGFITYLWIVTVFGCVILLVKGSMEETDIQYQMGDKYLEKRKLLSDIQKVDNKIAQLERFERIGVLLEEQLPQLGPPKYPAVELPVEGLRNPKDLRASYPPDEMSENIFSHIRNQAVDVWTTARDQVQKFLE
ncbi:MAG: hypothetical protein RBU29_00355 [bacterium]|jgi:hypothetical protein|nr:hypothetical protein [bacterium]